MDLIAPLVALVFAVTFAVIWRRARMPAYVLAFALGYVGFGLGYLANQFLLPLSVATFPIGHMAYSAGCAALVWGVCRRAQCRPPMVALALIYVVSTAALMIAFRLGDLLTVPLFMVNSGYGLMFALAALRLSEAPRQEPLDRLLLGLFIISAIQFFVRPPVMLLIDASTLNTAAYHGSLYFTVLRVFVTIFSVAVAMTLIGACIRDLVARTRSAGEQDEVSGLARRRAFEERVIAMLDEAAARDEPVSLIVADLDHFKRVNDIFGHQTGDAAIASFGKLIGQSIREGDEAGRIGGEEFCIAACNCTGAAAVSLADRMRVTLLEQSVEGLPADYRLTASFGIAEWRAGDSYGHVFARADRALFAAKQRGRNRSVLDRAEEPTRILPPARAHSSAR